MISLKSVYFFFPMHSDAGQRAHFAKYIFKLSTLETIVPHTGNQETQDNIF